MSDPALAVEDLGVVRDGTEILTALSLSIHAGDRLLIRGKSGAGKTTLFSVLGLLETPTSGVVRVDGDDVSNLSERRRTKIRRDRIGVVYQEFHLIEGLSVRENVAMPQEHAGSSDPDRVEELLDSLGVADRADAYPASLSGGEKQRVAIARALANDPDVILADEPTGQLDPQTAETVVELLCDLQSDSETALVVVSHDPRLADRFETVATLEDGSFQE